MPNFNSKEAANAYKSAVYSQKETSLDASERIREEHDRADRAEARAELAYRQNQKLLIATIILGVCGLIVDLLSNLDSIIRNISALLP